MTARSRRVFLVATEESGDRLGTGLMQALKAQLGADVAFAGVGGRGMEGEGLGSLFTIEQVSIIGFVAVARKLPTLLRLIRETADAAVAAKPDVLVIIDSPDFTQRVARRVRRIAPHIPIVNYVSPTVWAWRPGRAKAMRGVVDLVLAVLPFEPAVHERLGGARCVYVGHPLMSQLSSLRPNVDEAERRGANPPVLLVLPGSRRSEIAHHMPIFGDTLRRLRDRGIDFEAVLAVPPHLREAVQNAARDWPVTPRFVFDEDGKRAAFRVAHAALAKSGTVTLELAISGVPMVAAYRLGAFESAVGKYVVRVSSVILANLVVGENVVPEFILRDCTAEKLAPALAAIMLPTDARVRQIEAFRTLDDIMGFRGESPSQAAARYVIGSFL